MQRARCVAQFTVNGVMHSALHGEWCTRQCLLRCALKLFLQDGGIGIDSQLIRSGVDGLKGKGRKTFDEGNKLCLAYNVEDVYMIHVSERSRV